MSIIPNFTERICEEKGHFAENLMGFNTYLNLSIEP